MSLLCTYRKYTLLSDISQRELLGITYNQKHLRLTKAMALIQKTNESIKSSFNSIMNSTTAISNSIFQGKIQDINKEIKAPMASYNDSIKALNEANKNARSTTIAKGNIFNGTSDIDEKEAAEIKRLEDLRDTRRSEYGEKQMAIQEKIQDENSIFQGSQLVMAGASHMIDSIFDSANTMMMESLQREDANIQMDMANNAKILEMDKAELENVKKEEKDSVKREVASFGLD